MFRGVCPQRTFTFTQTGCGTVDILAHLPSSAGLCKVWGIRVVREWRVGLLKVQSLFGGLPELFYAREQVTQEFQAPLSIGQTANILMNPAEEF